MLKTTYVIVALFNVDGFEFEKELNGHFETAGDCVTGIIRLHSDITHECHPRYTYNGVTTKYVSQPSWMTNEQADRLIEKRRGISQ